MANRNPVEARLAQRAKNRKNRKPIDLLRLQMVMSDLIEVLDAYIHNPEAPPDIKELKDAGYLLSQLAGSYVKLIEVGEIEARTKKVEGRIDELEEKTDESRIAA